MQSASEHQGPLTFSATLSPHRSLSPNGFILLMTIVGAVSFIGGIAFLVMGAWPVLCFFGLDALLIFVAFRLNYRSGRIREVVDLSRDHLSLSRIHPSGRKETFGFNPAWVSVVLKERRNGSNVVCLASHGQAVPFGLFLTDAERREFAAALKTAIVEARNAPRS